MSGGVIGEGGWVKMRVWGVRGGYGMRRGWERERERGGRWERGEGGERDGWNGAG